MTLSNWYGPRNFVAPDFNYPWTMKATILTAILFFSLGIAAGTTAGAEDLPHPYFEATNPGSWAKYQTSISSGGETMATYTRMTDHTGGFAVEIVTEFLEGPGAGGGSTSIFALSPDFDWKRRFLSFGKALSGATFVMDGRPPMPQPEQMVTAMRESMAEYGGGFEAKGSAVHDGIGCDVYAFHAVLGGPNPGTISGELCLSAAVPFGLVHESAVSRSQNSAEYSFETMLVGTGVETPRSAPAQTAPSPQPAAKRLNVALAYQRGVIAFDFRVPDNTDGRVLEVALTNLGTEPLVIGVGTSTYAFQVGPPLGTLFFQPVYEQDIELAPGEISAEFHSAQIGDRGAREGSFRLVMQRGVPTLSGEIKVGKIEPAP